MVRTKKTPVPTKSTLGDKKIGKKKRRTKPGKGALRDIKKQQKLITNVVPRAPFVRLCREVVQEKFDEPLYMQRSALDALQIAGEAFLLDLYKDSLLITLNARRETLMPSDMRCAVKLKYGPDMIKGMDKYHEDRKNRQK